MNIVACYAVWNEARQIEESIRSVKAYVDRYVVIDAVFADNPVDATCSTDETRALCEAICAPVPLTYIASHRKLREYEARNLYLEQLAEGDWALVIDGDEVLYGACAAVQELADRIRSGALNGPTPPDTHRAAVGIPVYSQTVRFPGSALDMDAGTYRTAPILNSVGMMARFFRADAGLRYPALPSNRGLWRDGRWVGRPAYQREDVFLINHRLRQTFANYLADHEWLSKVRTG